MTDDAPQIYLVTPPDFAPARDLDRIAAVLDAHPVACLRLDTASDDAEEVTRAADVLRAAAHARDVPLVVARHVGLVERLGLDGVHLTDGARSVRAARAALGVDAILGVHCGVSGHDGLTAGEAGADYVAFGPVVDAGLGDGQVAQTDLFQWWSEMVEVPVVADGGVDAAAAARLAPYVDFLAVGGALWRADDPVADLGALREAVDQSLSAQP